MRPMKRLSPFVATLGVVVGLLVSSVVSGGGQPRPGSAADRFEVSDVMIPMRDGTKLNTKIFAPRDASAPLPIIFKRTPYGIDGSAGNFNAYFKALADEGYIFVFQDIRGKFGSEGTFVMQRPARPAGDTKALDEGTDTYDSIDWLIKNVRNNNGRVGMLGISYDGWTTIMGAIDPHPALKAISPQASPADMWLGDDFHHNGAFRLSYGFEYAAMMESRQGRPAVRLRSLRHLRLVSEPRLAGQRQREVPARQDPDLERLRRASRLRRVLAAPDDDSAPDEREGPDAERGRLVGSGGLLRSRPDLRGARAARRAEAELPRRRTVAARRLGGRDRRCAGRDSVRQRDGGVLPRSRAGAVLCVFPEGQGDA